MAPARSAGKLDALRRFRHIATALVRYGFADLAERLNIRGRVPVLRRRAPEVDRLPLPERTADLLQELGPTFVKLGQMLSMRPDILPEDFTAAFTRLQDRVRPFPEEKARAIIEESLGAKIEDLFDEFEMAPLASGSIAQVHNARLSGGRGVVVKVRRPGIESQIKGDLALLRQLAEMIERHVPEYRVYRPVEIVEEFGRSITRELDLAAEAGATAKFAGFFATDQCVAVPEIVWSHTRGNVLTMTRLKGTPLSDMDALDAEGVDRKKLAGVVADCFLRQFFEYGMFHGDPHPGNLLALGDDRLGLIDFGAVGHLTDEMISELTAALYAVSTGDVALVASVYEEIGVLDETPNRGALLADLQEIFDRYYGLPADRMDIRQVFSDMTAVARQHNARLPRELVIFGRALVTSLSVVQKLDPDVKISELVKPYVRRLVLTRLKPESLSRAGARSGYHILSLVRNLPGDLRSIVRKLRAGKLRIEFRHEGLEDFASELDRASNRLAFSVVTGAIIIGSSYVMSSKIGPTSDFLWIVGLDDVPLLGLVGFLIAGVMGLGLMWSIYRSGKLGN
jgi:ubiquinone biosynthesis protein